MKTRKNSKKGGKKTQPTDRWTVMAFITERCTANVFRVEVGVFSNEQAAYDIARQVREAGRMALRCVDVYKNISKPLPAWVVFSSCEQFNKTKSEFSSTSAILRKLTTEELELLGLD